MSGRWRSNCRAKDFAALTKPYTQPFGTIGPLAFVLGTFAIATGISTAPWLLPRVAATPSVYEARKALGWATVFSGLAILTISSVAVFMRDFALDTVMSERLGPLPKWLFDAATAHLVAFDPSAARLGFDGLKFDRDGVLFALPVATGLPMAFAYVLIAGALAAALVTASATTVSLAAVLCEDVVQGLSWEPAPAQSRVWIMRGFVIIVAICGALLTIMAPTDPLQLVLWALSITGASLFPVMILSIWWKRLTSVGAIIGVATGFAAAALAIFLSEVRSPQRAEPDRRYSGLADFFGFGLEHEFAATRENPAYARGRPRYPCARRRDHLRSRNAAPAASQTRQYLSAASAICGWHASSVGATCAFRSLKIKATGHDRSRSA